MEIPLKEHMESLLISIQKLEDERWAAHLQVHAMGQRAFDSAFITVDSRLETMNEFRAQIAGERSHFLSREVYDTEHASLEAKVDNKYEVLMTRLASLENYKSNMDGKFWMLGTLLTVITIGLNLAFKYFFHY